MWFVASVEALCHETPGQDCILGAVSLISAIVFVLREKLHVVDQYHLARP